MTSKNRGAFPELGFQACGTMPTFFMWVPVVELRPLCGKHFTDWATLKKIYEVYQSVPKESSVSFQINLAISGLFNGKKIKKKKENHEGLETKAWSTEGLRALEHLLFLQRT